MDISCILAILLIVAIGGMAPLYVAGAVKSGGYDDIVEK